MPYDPERHHRRSIRWQGYDYARGAAYFVTICAEHRALLFGKVSDGQVVLNQAGHMVTLWWDRIVERFHGVRVDGFVVMPNHVHGIIVIDQEEGTADIAVMANGRVDDKGGHVGPPLHERRSAIVGASHRASRASLPEIVGWYKTMTTNDYIRGVKERDWPPFRGRVWQRTYHDRVICDDDELDRVRHYIAENPANWSADPDNPVEATP